MRHEADLEFADSYRAPNDRASCLRSDGVAPRARVARVSTRSGAVQHLNPSLFVEDFGSLGFYQPFSAAVLTPQDLLTYGGNRLSWHLPC